MHILYIDDETMILEVITEMLDQLGHRITAVQDSAQALMLFHNNPTGFDIVMTDHKMPGLDGAILARKIKRINPDIPIVLVTGYSELVTDEEYKKVGIDAYIMKPVKLNDLRRIIETVRVEGIDPS